jgi:hypothetical protein
MTFYLGLSQPSWIGRTSVPICVARPRLATAKSLHRAAGPWVLDSGGFSELSKHGRWTITAKQYAAEVRWYVDQLGRIPDWIAPQDWMCEPDMLRRTGLTVREHQIRTVENYLELRELLADLPLMPVVQGWTFGQYLDCVEIFAAAGIDLTQESRVGVGSVCRRQNMFGAERIVTELRWAGLTGLHGFGLKITGLREFGQMLASAEA